MYKYILSFLVFFTLLLPKVSAQQPLPVTDSSSVVQGVRHVKAQLDSVLLSKKAAFTDSLMRATWILPKDSLKTHLIVDSIEKEYVFKSLNLQAWYNKYLYLKKKENPYQLGKLQPKGELWVIGFVTFLLITFAILKNLFSKQLQSIIQSFFSNRVLSNINKEDNLFTSWPFLFLFVQFGFIIGMFLFLVAQYYGLYLVAQGFKFFVSISILIIVLYALKILILRLLGVIFGVQKAVNEYVSILYLSYFNTSLIFIPLVLAFALSPLNYGIYYIAMAFLVIGLVFIFQFIRAGVTILSHYRFSKVYLFLYFCALEICPILILIKTIGL